MIQHVTHEIRPPKLDDCVGFYGLLGFEPVPVPPGIGDRAVWLEHRQTQIHLMPKPDARPDGGHVAVVVPEYQLTVERLRAAGHEVEPRREHWGSPRAFVRDPAGHLVELMEFAPPPAAGAGEA
jgi:catechol 2,3-dioxygenase-like lactoylglutathione lyase family enzyme